MSDVMDRPAAIASVTPETPIIIRRFRVAPNDLIALLPGTAPTRLGRCQSYQVLGGLGRVEYTPTINQTLPVHHLDEDVSTLRSAMEREGYRLRVVLRFPARR